MYWKLTFAVALLGCGASSTTAAPVKSESTAAQTSNAAGCPMMAHEGCAEHPGDCPMQLEGTTVRAEDLDGGAALVFTNAKETAELRERVQHMSEAHGQHAGAMGMQHPHDGPH